LAGWVWAAPPQATRASGLVRYVADGDTVYVRLAGKFEQQAVRLVGIDAPEICQDGGVAARDALQALLQDRIVELHIQGQDDYGRMLARVFLDGADVGRSMVMQGWAWSYRLGRDADPYSVEQQAARDAQLTQAAGSERSWDRLPWRSRTLRIAASKVWSGRARKPAQAAQGRARQGRSNTRAAPAAAASSMAATGC
jgi:hypothetical protein